MTESRARLLLAVIAVAALAAPAALLAEDYPTRPITIIVPAAAGSPSDFPARLASQILPDRLGQPVVIEYRPGAAGAIGARAAAAAAPDGYTLYIGNSSTLAAIPAVSAQAGYDPIKDFTPIVEILRGFQILVVDPASPWQTVAELVAYAKANPGKLNYGNTGTGGLPDLAAQLFMLRTGTKMTGVSYRGGNQSATAILGHVIDLTFETGASLAPLIRAGKLRALAAQTDVRSPLLPDVPTMAEAGVAGLRGSLLLRPGCARRHAGSDRRSDSCGDGRRPADGGDRAAHRQCRQRDETEYARAVRGFHRRPISKMGGSGEISPYQDRLKMQASNENELAGKVALVTGASRGIGRGIAIELAAAGCDVMLAARDGKALESVAAEIRARGRKAAIHAADLAAADAPAALVEALTRAFGRLDVLVNNAGAAKRGGFFDLSEQDWRSGFDLKFFAHVRLCRLAWPLLKTAGGSVVFISGIGARAPVADYMIGASVIGASIAFMKALADLAKHDGIQVNAVNPGSIMTDRFRHRLDIIKQKTGLDEAAAIERHRRELDITRFGTPEDVAAMVRFIVSPRGRLLHGSAIDIDGGQIVPLRMSVYEQ